MLSEASMAAYWPCPQVSPQDGDSRSHINGDIGVLSASTFLSFSYLFSYVQGVFLAVHTKVPSVTSGAL